MAMRMQMLTATARLSSRRHESSFTNYYLFYLLAYFAIIDLSLRLHALGVVKTVHEGHRTASFPEK